MRTIQFSLGKVSKPLHISVSKTDQQTSFWRKLGAALHSCPQVRARMSSTKFRLRNSFLHPPCARVGLVVKHVIKLQESSKDFTL
ncbi:hypothetical protein Hanom_Chr07g00645251 [Helianthus anomalus]